MLFAALLFKVVQYSTQLMYYNLPNYIVYLITFRYHGIRIRRDRKERERGERARVGHYSYASKCPKASLSLKTPEMQSITRSFLINKMYKVAFPVSSFSHVFSFISRHS
jgi:hypothetical protein